MNKSIKFEELLSELDSIVAELESGELDLEQSIEKYKLGIELSSKCKKMLEDAKAEVIKKMED